MGGSQVQGQPQQPGKILSEKKIKKAKGIMSIPWAHSQYKKREKKKIIFIIHKSFVQLSSTFACMLVRRKLHLVNDRFGIWMDKNL